MNIAIVDDDSRDRKELKAELESYFRVRSGRATCIDCYPAGDGVMPTAARYSIIFLDIVMPETDGMETARRLRAQGFHGALVFTTVLVDCVFDAFSVEAADYLLKPIVPERLACVMDRLAGGGSRTVSVQRGRHRDIVNLADIAYCEVRGRHLFVHRADRSVLEFRGKMEEFAAQAGDSFFRAHRGFLVNLAHVTGFSDSEIELAGGECVPLSRLRAAEFRRRLTEYLAGRGM